MGKVLDKTQCPECAKNGNDTSKDNLVCFEDGGKECFACGYRVKKDASEQNDNDQSSDQYRGLSFKVLSNMDCFLTNTEIGYLYNTGYKYRSLKTKKFWWDDGANNDNTRMYLLDNCDTSKPLIITEGEIDALSCWEVGFQACSIINGASAAEKSLKHDIKTLKRFPLIILALDNDQVGMAATEKCVNVLHDAQIPVKVIIVMGYKDANDFLWDNELKQLRPGGRDLLRSLLQPYYNDNRPKGLVFGSELDYNHIRAPLPPAAEVPLQKVQQMTKGMFVGNFWGIAGGSSSGKSTLLRQFSKAFRAQNLKVAHLAVEEHYKTTAQAYIAEETNTPLVDIMIDPTIIPQDIWDPLYQEIIATDDMVFLNEDFNITPANVLEVCNYLAYVKKYDVIMVDTLTAINDSISGKKNKVEEIDRFVGDLDSLARKSMTRIIMTVQLKRPEISNFIRNGVKSNVNLDWSEGREPTMHDLKGSGAIEQKPDVIVAIARNSKDESLKNQIKLFILKNRWAQVVGSAGTYEYIPKTGRLVLK